MKNFIENETLNLIKESEEDFYNSTEYFIDDDEIHINIRSSKIGERKRLFTYEDILNLMISIGQDIDSNEGFESLPESRQREIIDELKTEINKHI